MASDLAARVRATCLAMPGATEKLSHGAPAFFAGKQFAMFWPDGHHDHEFPHLWLAAAAGTQEALVASSGRFFRPPYVGHRGWVGVRLDGDVDWDEVDELIDEAYRVVTGKDR
jgi:predicted DNA-binding protein (MmcQ/YjbR family)